MVVVVVVAGVNDVVDQVPSHRALAADGFHPGEPVYRYCAATIAQHIASHVFPTLHLDTRP